jgi:hypothetical protein
MPDPLPERIRRDFPGDNEMDALADFIQRVYDGSYKLTVLESLFCLKQLAGTALEARYQQMVVERDDRERPFPQGPPGREDWP